MERDASRVAALAPGVCVEGASGDAARGLCASPTHAATTAICAWRVARGSGGGSKRSRAAGRKGASLEESTDVAQRLAKESGYISTVNSVMTSRAELFPSCFSLFVFFLALDLSVLTRQRTVHGNRLTPMVQTHQHHAFVWSRSPPKTGSSVWVSTLVSRKRASFRQLDFPSTWDLRKERHHTTCPTDHTHASPHSPSPSN
jgi:hypothetical protein